MKASDFNASLIEALRDKDVVIQKHPLNYNGGSYEFLKISSREIGPNDKIMLLRAGIHGDEISGPLTILNNAVAIIDQIHTAGLKVILYPLGNPSGFENGLRYNVDNDRGDAGNGDFMRYELLDGKIVDDLGASNEFKQWFWSSDERFQVHLPIETRLMHTLLKQDPLKNVVAVFDLHQDYITPNAPPAAYHYSFGDLNVYDSIIQKIEKNVPVLKDMPIGAGFHVTTNASGTVSQDIAQEEMIKTDDHGFIVRHDGSLPDLLYRMGTPYCVTSETMGSTSLESAIKVNLYWIEGLVNLARK